MTVFDYLNRNCVPCFRIITFRNWKVIVLYDSDKELYDIPNNLYDSIVEKIYNENGIIEIEV